MAALTKEGGQKLDCKNFVLMNQLVKKNVNYQVSAMKECWYELYVVSQKASKKTSSHHSKKIRQFAENIYNILNHALKSGPF